MEKVPPSSFVEDMRSAVNCSSSADIVFYVPEHVQQALSETELPFREMFAHKCILAKLPYFHTMFHGSFMEASTTEQDGRMRLSIEGCLQDGISLEIFAKMIMFLYTGDMRVVTQCESDDVMGLLVAANRVGLISLVQHCEKLLSTHLTDYPENAKNCYDFAQRFNVPRLERQCKEMLEALAASEEKKAASEEKAMQSV
jgi:hypothetical protein